jgi:uncharacterized OB-fold protein
LIPYCDLGGRRCASCKQTTYPAASPCKSCGAEASP